MTFFKDREAVARYVASQARRLTGTSALTIIIEPDRYAGFCVSIATTKSSEDTQTQPFSKGLDVT